MITSSVLNSITFKYLNGGLPNKWNTLHENRKQGGFTVAPYCQKFNKDETIYLQFESDSATIPTLKIYANQLYQEIAGTLVSSYSGVDDRYFFNFEILLSASYYDKVVRTEVVQGAFTLTGEPIYYTDLAEEIEHGSIKLVKYTNLDRNNSDLSNYWVDWSVIDFMQFYVESVDIDPNDPEENEVLTGSQSKTIVSSSNFSGINFQTSGIPDYLELKIKAASSLDYFEINGLQYIKEGDVDSSRFGDTTLHEISVNLTEKNTVGLNVDDLGIEFIDQEEVPMSIIPKRNTAVTGAGWQIENPEGYMLHSAHITHASTSAGDAVVKLGTTVGGDELIDIVQGDIKIAEYTIGSKKWKAYSFHFLKDPDNSSTLYLAATGAGAVLDVIINFDTVTPQ
jgi:hypothetical protein